MNHPEELLAIFVDGSASLEDRAVVEAHLAFCEQCSREVESARQGRTLLVQLPEVDAPPVDLQALGLHTMPSVPTEAAATVAAADATAPEVASEAAPSAGEPAAAGPPVVPPPADPATAGPVGRPRPVSLGHGRLPARVIQAVVGVAVVLLGVFLVVHLVGGSNSSNVTSGERAAAPPSFGAQAPAPLPSNAQAYTSRSLVSLANQLTREARRFGVKAQLAPSASDTTAAGSNPGTTTQVATSCIDRATGLDSNARLYFLQGGTYEGTPAYIGAFVTGTGNASSMVVVAVTIDGCQAQNVIHEKI